VKALEITLEAAEVARIDAAYEPRPQTGHGL
jgi:hypothetical protein